MLKNKRLLLLILRLLVVVVVVELVNFEIQIQISTQWQIVSQLYPLLGARGRVGWKLKF